MTEYDVSPVVYWCRSVLVPFKPPRPLFTVNDMDRLVRDEPALWGWRQSGYGCVRFVQSWENRPTRKEWIRLKRLIRFRLPFQIHAEFRGCPR